MRRGEVWWADLAAPAGRRPVVLLSRDATYDTRASVTVAPVTSTIRNIPAEVPLGPEDGLGVKCVANMDDIITIRKSRLRAQITDLSSEKITAVNRAIIFALDLR